jgi:hypothetical protein
LTGVRAACLGGDAIFISTYGVRVEKEKLEAKMPFANQRDLD